MRAEPGELVAREAGHLERTAVCGRPHRLRHVAEVEAAGRERLVPQDRQRPEAGGVRREPPPQRRPARRGSAPPARAARASARRARPRSHVAVRASPPAPRCRASSASSRSRRSAPASAGGRRAGRAARSRRRRAARARRRVGGDERHAARERLVGLVRDHAPRLRRVPKTPSAHAAARTLRQLLVRDPRDPFDVPRALASKRLELAAPGDAQGKLGSEPRRREDRLQPVQRDQLADEERRLARFPGGPEQALLRADEAHGDARPRDAGEAARKSAFASVSATTRSAARSAAGRRRERACRRASPAGSGPGRRRASPRATRAR